MSKDSSTTSQPNYGRALLTDDDRAIFTGEKEVDKNHELKQLATLRNRFKTQLPTDLELLKEHRPEMFDTVVQIVTQEGVYDLGEDVTGRQIVSADFDLNEEQAENTSVGLCIDPNDSDDVYLGERSNKTGRYVLVRVSVYGDLLTDHDRDITDTPHEVIDTTELTAEQAADRKIGIAITQQGTDAVFVPSKDGTPGTYFLVREEYQD